MPIKSAASIIAITYGVLLVLWLVTWSYSRRRAIRNVVVIQLEAYVKPISRPGSVLSGLGVLFVFMVNIGTIFLVFAAAVSTTFENILDGFRFELPEWMGVIGGLLFVLYGIWGFLVLVFNPHYTPLFRRQERQLAIAMKGPYAIVRHPRYAGEALLNIILFLLTGVWLPLLGVVAWRAVWRQALLEEEFLMSVAPIQYGKYRSVTGMFLPLLKWRDRDRMK